MGQISKLAGQTAIYGISSIIGRFLNYLLVPLYTYTFAPSQYGVVTEFYAYVVVLQILLTYGMETGFFRFSTKLNDINRVFSTVLTSILTTSTAFVSLILIYRHKLADLIGYHNHSDYLVIFALILSFDAVSAIFFAKLRSQNKATKFAVLKIVNISINIFFNLFFLLACPKLEGNHFIDLIYNPSYGVGYIFISNLIASLVTLLLFIPDFIKIKYKFDFHLLKQILKYSLPLLLTGLTGVVNEMADRILLKYYTTVPPGTAEPMKYVLYQLGIYGANAKLAVIMMMYVQAFRYAAEPFFFSTAKKITNETLDVFSRVMTYFIASAFLIFLGVLLNLDIIKYFISSAYFEGLKVVFPLMLSRMLVGVFFILSFWYKLTDKTHYGILIFTAGAAVTVTFDILLIPKYGYIAAAWTNFGAYAVMVTISYFWSRKYLPVHFKYGRILLYSGIAIVFYFLMKFIKLPEFFKLLTGNLLILIYIYIFAKLENIKVKKLYYELKSKLKRKNNK